MAATLVAIVVVLAGRVSSASKATPIGKVVELIDDLKQQVEVEGKHQALLFDKFTKWCHNETRIAEETIEETETKIQELKAALEEQEAFREGKAAELETQIAELAANEKELANTTAQRALDRKAYEEAEASYVSSIDALERAIAVLQEEQPTDTSALQTFGGAPLSSASAAPLPSLVEVAKNLRRTLEHSKDMRLTVSQQETLDELFRAAVDARPSSGLSFLQVRDPTGEQYGDYESKTGGVQGTLQSILDKAKSDRDTAMTEEEKAKNTFEKFEASLNEEIAAGKENLADIKAAIAASQQDSAQKEASLADESDLLKATQDQLAEVKAELKAKEAGYKKAEVERSEEIMALQKAATILTSDAAKRFSQQQTIGTPEGDDAAPSFLQLQVRHQRVRDRAIRLARSASGPGLVLLALRSTTHAQGKDPFAKAKDMIQAMLEKLLTEQNEEAEHHSWCQKELAESKKSKHDKTKTVEKLQDRIDGLDAEITTLGDDLTQIKAELADMAEALAKANEIRNEERAEATVAIKNYHDAQALLKNALTVLQEFYGKEDDDAAPAASFLQLRQAPEAPDLEYKTKVRAASGVIGILEVAISDFAKQEESATMNEDAAQKTFEDLMKTSEVKRAVFLKDVEYKERTKIKQEGERARTAADLRSYTKELKAVTEYLSKLVPQCTFKVDTYEERKSRREAELQSLQQALQVLQGEGVA